MTQGAFGSQFVEQVFGAVKRIGGEIAILEQSGPASRNFAFSEQGNAPFLGREEN